MPLASLPRIAQSPVLGRARALRLVILLVCLTAASGVSAAQSAPAAQPASGPQALHPNVRVVQQFHQAVASGDQQALAALVDPELAWTIPGAHSMAGTRKGLKEILPLLWQLKRAGIGAEPLFLGGNDNLVLGLSRGRVKRGGVEQEFFWVRVYELRGGRILRVQDFPSDQSAADVFFWQAMPPKPEEQPIIDYPPRPGR